VGKADEIMEQVKKFGSPKKVDYLAPVPDEERKEEKKAPKGAAKGAEKKD
jgi:hypothetical protein